jgi:hypothetical protein
MIEEITGGWRKLQHEELRLLYCLQNIIRLAKSRRKARAYRVASVERMNSCNVLAGKREEG